MNMYYHNTWSNLQSYKLYLTFFDVLLTVHLSIILAINQLNAQNLLLQ